MIFGVQSRGIRIKCSFMNVKYSTEDFCSICYEPYTAAERHNVVRLGCHHAFGRYCISLWATVSSECTVCRQGFVLEELGELSTFRRLYNRRISLATPTEVLISIGISLAGGVCGLCVGIAIGTLTRFLRPF